MARPEKKESKTSLSHVSSVEVIASTSQLNTDPEEIAIIPHNAPFSSAEIETVSGKDSQRSSRVSRSQSLSRTLIRSFRRKKKPTQLNDSTGESNQASNPNDSRITRANQSPAAAATTEEDASPKNDEEQSKISRILRMSSINRLKLRRNKSTSSLNDDSYVKRSTSLVNFFKRERKEKVSATTDVDTTVTESENQVGTRKSQLRESMRRFRSNKSSSTSTEEEEGAVASTSEKNRWRPRRSISMFGSSFNMRKIFHGETVTEEDNNESPKQEPKLGAMKRSEGSRQKLNQLTSTPAETAATPEECNESVVKTRRNSIGEKLKAGRNLFKRDSFILLKKKSLSPEVDPAEESPTGSDVVNVENDSNQGEDEFQPTLNGHNLEEGQAVAEDNCPELAEVQTQQQISVASQPESKDHQEKPHEETNQTKEAKAVTQEANVVVSQAREDRHAENRHGHNLEADKNHLIIGLGLTDCPKQEKLEKDFLNSQDSIADQLYVADFEMPANLSVVRMVALRKSPGEPLGLTVKTEDGQLVVARILGGGAVDRQGLLHVGDIIGEVNGVVVRSAEQLQVEIARCKENIQLKVLPSFREIGSNGVQSHVRAHFDYDPKEDKLLPCPEIGLAFKKGDILQVVNQSDPNWWQAQKVGWSGPAGLIPSQELEERRKAYVAPEADFVHKIGFCGTRISKKKKKMMYQIKSSVDLDKAELLLYEEVTRMPPFRRKSLVLIGSEGIGRRTLKNRLINSDPDRFGTTMPHTSRPMRELEEDGMGYWFVSREEMEHDTRDHQFLECGEHNGHLYGTKLDTIRTIIRQGKMCVLDCSPNALKTLHSSPEFMPYVIFLAAPGMEHLKEIYANGRYSSRNLTFDRSSSIRFSSRRARTLESLTSLYEEEDFKNALEESARIQRTYEKYFDQIIINDDPDVTFRKVVEALEILSNQHQWVPVSWVY